MRGDVPDNLLLGVGGKVRPLIHHLDAHVASGDLLDALDEIRDGWLDGQLAGGIGQSQHNRLSRAAGLVLACVTTAAGHGGEHGGRGENECRKPAANLHPVHGLTPCSQDRAHGKAG